MVIFRCSYDTSRSNGYDIVVAENETIALEVMKERKGKDIKCKFSEISLEQVRISNLTAGDLIRLLDMRAHRGL